MGSAGAPQKVHGPYSVFSSSGFPWFPASPAGRHVDKVALSGPATSHMMIALEDLFYQVTFREVASVMRL
jgi:hypothetical protein